MYNEFGTVKTLNSSKEVFFRIDKRTSLKSLQISPDMRRVAYVITERLGLFKKQYRVAIESQEGESYDKILGLYFSPDSSRLAYLAQKGKNMLLVLDGKVVAEHPGIGVPFFSPNGRHYAYSISRGDKFSVCFDDIEGPSYDDGDFRIVFSPDSNRFSYRVSRGKKQLVVIDGKESQEYDGTGENSLAFSPNSQRLAYAARNGKNWFVVENGEKGQDYKVLSAEGVVFSPDSKHYAYTAAVEGEGFVVVDGKEGWHYDDVLPKRPVFSPDSSRIAYWASINDSVDLIKFR